jgi:TPR repeat protein
LWNSARRSGQHLTQEIPFIFPIHYLHGHGRDKNLVEAKKWFLKDALQGHARSQFTLGLIYNIGEGVERNNMKAYKWFYLAMLNDYFKAAGMVEYMAEKITADEIDVSKSAAIKCFESEYQQCEIWNVICKIY